MPRKRPFQQKIVNMDGILDRCTSAEGGSRQIDRGQWKQALRVFAEIIVTDKDADYVFEKYRQRVLRRINETK